MSSSLHTMYRSSVHCSNSRGRERAIRAKEDKRDRKRECVCVCVPLCVCVVVSPAVCIHVLSSVRNSDIYSISCQRNQHQYVRSRTNNTTNKTEAEAAVYLTRLLKYSRTVQNKSMFSCMFYDSVTRFDWPKNHQISSIVFLHVTLLLSIINLLILIITVVLLITLWFI